MLNNQKLHVKLSVILLLSFAAALTVTMGAVKLSWEVRLEERKAKLRDVVIAANGALADISRMAREERLTREAEGRATRKLVEAMASGSEDSLFIIGYDGTVLADPGQGHVGQNVLNITDSHGRAFIRSQIEVAKAGGGFVDYSLRRPDSDKPSEKLSYVSATPDGTALIGSGVFIDDLKEEFWRTTGVFLGAISALFVITFGLAGRVANSIVRPIRRLLRTMEHLSHGQLDVPVEGVKRRDEVGDLARGVESWKEHAVRRQQLQHQVETARLELLHQSTHDEVTGLPNARYLMGRLEDQLGRQKPVAIIIISMTGLDRIAARHGRDGQIHVIRTLAARLGGFCGAPDIVARIDGDEFAVLTHEPLPLTLAANIRTGLSAPVQWSSLILDVSVSVGLASSDEVPGSAEELMQSAIAAGRNTGHRDIVIYTPELRSRLERENKLEARLRAAVDQGEINLALQPKVDARSGRLIGAEALARWHDEEFGAVAPFEFIPIAERMGIIGDLDSVILRRALDEAARWHAAGLGLTVAVNVSAIELRSGDLVNRIASALGTANCSPSQLVIELTESAVAEDPADATRQLSALKGLGVSLSLDDFGTGYSSLTYLRRFPIDTLKIDRSFVIDTPQDRDASAVAHSIVSLARSLNMRTVAEGVETEEQAAFLRRLGVSVLQGYLYGRPISPDMFLTLARSQSPTRSALIAGA